MTYAASQVAYWVGQANDLSTGQHPTGWSSGQRWSETAEEWRLMFASAATAGIDTSTGRHPTGWTSGQYWSETAAEWMAMYDIEYAAARDNSSGQPNKPSGVIHPPGYATGQLWSVTATQWNSAWTGEWNLSHDPQGFAHSYPGQAANAVYWSSSAGYWRGQADNYWGPSRTWNSGVTWESQAHNYWGPSRTWNSGSTWEYLAGYHGWVGRTYNSGESWEAAYNRVYTDRYNSGYSAGYAAGLPRGFTETVFSLANGLGTSDWANTGAATATVNPFGFTAGGSTIYCQKAGTYIVRMAGQVNGGSWGWPGGLRILLNGGAWVERAGQGYNSMNLHVAEAVNAAVGTAFTFQFKTHGAGGYGQGQFFQGEAKFYFVPTPSVPT